MDGKPLDQWHVLALSPHTDDAELGSGGTLAQFSRLGAHVTYIAFSRAEPAHGEDSLEECKLALKVLGVSDIQFWGYSVRYLDEHRQKILDRLIHLRDSMRVDLVFVPARYDVHQDHRVVTTESIRAFKKTRILGYDLPWNTVGESRLDLFVPLCESDVQQKEQALSCYTGQQGRSFFESDTVRAIARFRGEQCGEQYAEGFECIRWKL
ncbi:MAG: PIG-L family deacetylase [Nitrospirae bacterium]|nr:PIG-L family deacetylase [Nitrospirota bacterium]